MQPQIVEKEEEERKEEARAAQKSAGVSGTTASSVPKQSPVTSSTEFQRNEFVTIEKDGETRELKFKKAEQLLSEGWTVTKK